MWEGSTAGSEYQMGTGCQTESSPVVSVFMFIGFLAIPLVLSVFSTGDSKSHSPTPAVDKAKP